MRDLATSLSERLAGLPPPERRPAPNSTAAELVKLLGEVEAAALRSTLMGVRQWLVSVADEAGLTLLGESRSLKRLPDEPLETYRTRVLGAFEFWELAGTLPGVQLALEQAGYRAIVVEHGQEGDTVRWAEFSVIVRPLQPLAPSARWGETTWGGGSKWGFELPAVPLSALPGLVKETKPAHARLRRMIWSPQGRFWGGGMRWGEGRSTPPKPAGWGIQLGYQGFIPADRTDSGPAWGEGDIHVLYDMEGNYAPEVDR